MLWCKRGEAVEKRRGGGGDETLIQLGRCQLSAPSMHKIKTGVQTCI